MMIDVSQQGKGYGKAALEQIIEFIKLKPLGSSDRVTLTCNKDNTKALKLYFNMGFLETGAEDEEEIELSMTVGH